MCLFGGCFSCIKCSLSSLSLSMWVLRVIPLSLSLSLLSGWGSKLCAWCHSVQCSLSLVHVCVLCIAVFVVYIYACVCACVLCLCVPSQKPVYHDAPHQKEGGRQGFPSRCVGHGVGGSPVITVIGDTAVHRIVLFWRILLLLAHSVLLVVSSSLHLDLAFSDHSTFSCYCSCCSVALVASF